ncbi:MAG: DUF1080 domain-containing protein [Prolixibacteraceae bacterium]|nr:DUF1080 domain-containing protein [Prolixibacteraceae bacterium]
MRTLLILIVFLLIFFEGTSAQKVIYSDDFTSGLKQWTIEKSSDETNLQLRDSLLDVVAPGGITLWFNNKLKGNVHISFEARIIDEGGTWDRVSDLNCFWMANDPEHPDDFFARSEWRNGIFGRYYSLSLYYAGYGGNSNTTTRFRKYNGDFQAFAEKQERPEILKEYTNPPHLITPNQWYHIEIIMHGKIVRYIVNNEILFDYNDENPYKSGYFGLRTVKNHIQYRDFKVVELIEK